MSDNCGAARVPSFVPEERRPICGGCGQRIEPGEVFGWQCIGKDRIAVGCVDCVMADHAKFDEDRVFNWRVPYAIAGGIPRE